jgi:GntR family transcriptional regulator
MIEAPESIDHNSKLPLYHQLYEILHRKIINRQLKPGDKVPTESELMETFHVSRITVRAVLDMLVKEGLVYRQRAKGTFVAHTTLEHGLSRIVNFTENMMQRGFKPGTKVLFSGLTKAPKDIAEKLNVEEGEELTQLDRLRLADGEPMCIEKSHLIHRHCPGILRYDFSKKSLRKVKSEKYGINWIRAKQSIKAINAPKEIADVLSIKKGAAVLLFERISFSQANIPMEFLQAYYRADRYTLYNELQGGDG